LGPVRFEHAMRKELARRGRLRPCLRILRNLYAALADPTGVIAHRPGAFERISWLIEDWDTVRAKLADTETRMVTVLEAWSSQHPDRDVTTPLRPKPASYPSRDSGSVPFRSREAAVHTAARVASPWASVSPVTWRMDAQEAPGGPSSTLGTYSTSWIWPSKVRLSVMSRATSG
jgi:hypothetical protein